MSFPVIKEINEARVQLFNTSHNFSGLLGASNAATDSTVVKRVSAWMGHKAVTLISMPANLVGFCGGLGACAGSACTLGALKIGIYALTLGNVKPQFSTGCSYLLNGTLSSGAQLFYNGGELAYDSYNAVHIVFDRIVKGFKKASDGEKAVTWTEKNPSPLSELTRNERMDYSKQERPFANLAKHTIYSIFSVPADVIAGCVSAVATVAFSALFVGKAAIYATTNIEIPVPTYIGKAAELTAVTFKDAATDTFQTVGDGFIFLYKTSAVLKIDKIATTAMGVISYIPEAIFG